MMKFVAYACILVISLPAIAADESVAGKKPSGGAVSSRVAVNDPEALSLTQAFPQRHQGIPISQIISWLDALKAKKGEFETTAAYTARVASLRSSELANGVKMDDTITLTRNVADWAKYDADKEIMTVKLVMSPLGPLSDQRSAGIFPLSSKTDKSEYQGSNAYGAMSTITRIDTVQVIIQPPMRNSKKSGKTP